MAATTKALVPTVPPLFKRILSVFPQDYFRYCFAYGSGVFRQGDACGSNPMIDMIFVVDDPIGFHAQNVLWNPSHYSSVKYLGHNFISKIQELWPAKVYFNTLIPVTEEGILLKYGVVKSVDLIDDLYDWDYIYLAGRLHKPVLEIGVATGELKSSLLQNLYNALHAALLILPGCFSELELYKTISALSYKGDFRMVIGENKNKVNNIVDNQAIHFRHLYRPLLNQLGNYVEVPNGEPFDQVCLQDMSSESRLYHLFQLPKTPQQALVKYWRSHGGRRKDIEDVLRDLSKSPDVGEMLSICLKGIVFKSSCLQSIKGIITAGLSKSVAYSNSKINKMLKSK